MAEQLHVVVATFKNPMLAEDAIKAIKDAGIKLADQALIQKTEDGKLVIAEGKDAGGGRGFVYGAVATGVLEVLAGPVGWTMLAGGIAGGLVAKFHDAGVPTKRLEELGATLEIGQAAALAIARDGDEGIVQDTLRNQGGDVATVTVTDSLKKALEDGTAEDASVPA